MARRLIGTDTTGTDGSVTIPYTGTGAGLVQMDVETEIDGSIVSETYGIIDGVLFDTATSFDTNKWTDYGVTRSHSSDGTTLSQGTDENARYQSKYTITDDLAVEFEIKTPSSATENPRLYLRGQTIQLYPSDFPREEWNKFRVEFRNLNIKIYANDTYLYEINPPSVNTILQLRALNTEFTFKNFVIYPI